MAGGSQVKNGLSVKYKRKNVKMKKKSARASPAGETSQRHRRDHAYFIGNHCGRVAGTLTCRGEVAPLLPHLCELGVRFCGLGQLLYLEDSALLADIVGCEPKPITLKFRPKPT